MGRHAAFDLDWLTAWDWLQGWPDSALETPGSRRQQRGGLRGGRDIRKVPAIRVRSSRMGIFHEATNVILLDLYRTSLFDITVKQTEIWTGNFNNSRL